MWVLRLRAPLTWLDQQRDVPKHGPIRTGEHSRPGYSQCDRQVLTNGRHPPSSMAPLPSQHELAITCPPARPQLGIWNLWAASGLRDEIPSVRNLNVTRTRKKTPVKIGRGVARNYWPWWIMTSSPHARHFMTTNARHMSGSAWEDPSSLVDRRRTIAENLNIG